jgi:hypothetical protein
MLFPNVLVNGYERIRLFYNKLSSNCITDYNKFENKLPFKAPEISLSLSEENKEQSNGKMLFTYEKFIERLPNMAPE